MTHRARIIVLAMMSALALAFVVVLLLAHRAPSGSSSAGASVAGSGAPSASGFDGAALPPGRRVRNFTLTDQDGRRVSLSDFRGQVTILTFLYTTCGPTCILIAQQIRGALDELAKPVPVLIVSAKPAADDPGRIARFLASTSLSGRVDYLTGSLQALRPVWQAYGVIPASAGAGAFDRSASVLLLDRSGAERVLFQQEQLTPEALTHDIRKLS